MIASLIFLIISSTDANDVDEWQKEIWTVGEFTDALGGGPSTGPVLQAGGRVFSLAAGKDGVLFLACGQFIDIVTPEGFRYHLAGTGEPGFRDGPAHLAQFYMGKKAVYGSHNIASSPSGDLFVADSGNGRVRRLFKKSGQWFVETWAGKGSVSIEPRKTGNTRDIKISGTILAIAVNSMGQVYVATRTHFYRVSKDGRFITHMGNWPASVWRNKKHKTAAIIWGDSDAKGNVYFVSRTPDFIIRVDIEGRAENIAGIAHHGKKPVNIGDGLAKDAFFDTLTSIVADLDGKKVYVSCGDEYTIRRVPTDGKTKTATLMMNGRWYQASVHPKIAHGPAVLDTQINGKLKPDGKLTVFMMNHLAGKDSSNVLYGWLIRSVGMSPFVHGEGLLSTKVFKIFPSYKDYHQ